MLDARRQEKGDMPACLKYQYQCKSKPNCPALAIQKGLNLALLLYAVVDAFK